MAETPCPAPSRFWEVAGGDSWRAGELLHIETCLHCQAAERAICHVAGRGGDEPTPAGWNDEDTVDYVEQRSTGWAAIDRASASDAPAIVNRLPALYRHSRVDLPERQSIVQTWPGGGGTEPESTAHAYPDGGSITGWLDRVAKTTESRLALPAEFGDYRVINQIAAGGMGVIFKARDVALDRIVAIKVIRRFVGADEQPMDRLFREARISAALDHPAIARVYNVGQIDGMPYIVREFVEGKSLSEWAREDVRIAHTDLAGIIALVAEALHHAHKSGIIHRDVKPSNILIDKELSPHLIDFGLARSRAENEEASITQLGQVIGTPIYMSPEQAEARPAEIGPATDIYSLGATLYTLLAGQPPFRGQSALETIQLVRSSEPLPPSQLEREVPRDLETICLKALAKDPRKRYATAREMAEDLRRFQRGSPISGRPPSARERAARLVRRHRWSIATICLAGAAAALGASLALMVTSYSNIGLRSGNRAAADASGAESRALRLAVNRGTEAELRKAVTKGEEVLRNQPGQRESLQSLAGAYRRLGDLFVNTDRLREGEWAYNRAVTHLKQSIQIEAGDEGAQKDLAEVLSNLSETARALREADGGQF